MSTKRPKHKSSARASPFREVPGSQAAPPRRVAPPIGRDERVLKARFTKVRLPASLPRGHGSGLRLYFGEDVMQNGTLVLDGGKIPSFQEWYIFDYVTSEGERIIDLLAHEKGADLPAAQRQMLDDCGAPTATGCLRSRRSNPVSA